MLTFLLAMENHPESMRRAQEELDTVCKDRLPTIADRKQLPYLDAVLAEVLRWVSITPLSPYFCSSRSLYTSHAHRPVRQFRAR